MFFGNWSLVGIGKHFFELIVKFLDYVFLHLHIRQKYEGHFEGSWMIVI